MVTATINGEARTVPDGTTLGDLLRELALSSEGIAVARNGAVVRRAALDSEAIAEGDNVEIIRAVAGG